MPFLGGCFRDKLLLGNIGCVYLGVDVIFLVWTYQSSLNSVLWLVFW